MSSDDGHELCMNQNGQLFMSVEEKSFSDSFFNVNFKLNLKLTQIGVFISKACAVPDDLKMINSHYSCHSGKLHHQQFPDQARS